LALPLGFWAPCSLGLLTFFRIGQSHFLFRDMRWDQSSDVGLLAVPSGFALPLFIVGYILSAIIPSVLAGQCGCAGIGSSGADEKDDQPPTRRDKRQQWALFLVSLVSYGFAMTLPLIDFDMSTPQLYLQMSMEDQVNAKPFTMGTDSLQSGGDYSVSNLQYILDSYQAGMPCSAIGLVTSCLLIPAMIFGNFLILLLQPRCVGQELLKELARSQLGRTPWLFSYAYFAVLMVGLLNIGDGAMAVLVRGTTGTGLVPWFVYSVSSVVLAQLVHAELEAEEANPHSARVGNHIPQGLVANVTQESYMAAAAAVVEGLTRRPRPKRTGSPNKPALVRQVSTESCCSDCEDMAQAPDCRARASVLIITLGMLAVASAAPCLILQFRLSGAVIERSMPSLLDMYAALAHEMPVGRVLLLVAGILPSLLWAVLVMMQGRFETAPVTKDSATMLHRLGRLECLIRPWVSVHVWAFSVVFIVYNFLARNKGMAEVCVSFPSPPVSFAAVVAVGCMVIAGIYAAEERCCTDEGDKTAASGIQSPNVRSRSPARQPAGLATSAESPKWLKVARSTSQLTWLSDAQGQLMEGQSAVLTWAPTVVWCLVLVALILGAPAGPPGVTSPQDLTDMGTAATKSFNQMIKERIPRSAGDCEAMRKQFAGSPSAAENHGDCVGDKPMTHVIQGANKYAPNTTITGRWITGLDTLKLTSLAVDAPTFRPASESTVGTPGAPLPLGTSLPAAPPAHLSWNVTLNGAFSGLRIWGRATTLQHNWIDGYVCCADPFRFSIRAYAECTDDGGFEHPAKLDLVHVDALGVSSQQTRTTPTEVDTKIVDMSFAPKDEIESQLRGLFANLGSFVLTKQDGSRENLMVILRDALRHIVTFNFGARCALKLHEDRPIRGKNTHKLGLTQLPLSPPSPPATQPPPPPWSPPPPLPQTMPLPPQLAQPLPLPAQRSLLPQPLMPAPPRPPTAPSTGGALRASSPRPQLAPQALPLIRPLS